MNRKKFSNLISKLRKESDLTQQDFSNMFNVSFQAVSKWENGESFPDIDTLEKLSRYYSISINDLLDGNYNVQENINKENEMCQPKKFGKLLNRLRKESNLTQQEFAKIFNVSFQSVSKWEIGESLPDIATLENVSKYYKISINDLLNGNYNSQRNINNEDSILENDKKCTKNDQLLTFTFSKKKNIFKITWC